MRPGAPRRRRFSPSRRALEQGYGRPWDEVALEFVGRELSLSDIALEWEAVTGQSFSTQTVRRILRAAPHRAWERGAGPSGPTGGAGGTPQ